MSPSVESMKKLLKLVTSSPLVSISFPTTVKINMEQLPLSGRTSRTEIFGVTLLEEL